MNVSLVYDSHPKWPKFRWLHDAFRDLGCFARQVQTLEELKQDAELTVFQQRFLPMGYKNVVGVEHTGKWAQVWWDLLLAQPHQELVGRWLPFLKCMDVVFVKERLLNEYRQLGINPRYGDQGCPIDWPKVTPGNRWDVLVFGTKDARYQQRHADVQTLVQAGVKVGWVGNGSTSVCESLPECPVEQLPELMSQARCVLAVDLRHDIPGYWSDRVWLACGAGMPVVKRKTPGDEHLPVVTYSNETELIESVSRADLELGERAYRERRTYRNVAQEILSAGQELC